MLKEVKKCGNSGHIILPASLIGHSVEIRADELIGDNTPITRKEVKKLIEDELYAARQGYG